MKRYIEYRHGDIDVMEDHIVEERKEKRSIVEGRENGSIK